MFWQWYYKIGQKKLILFFESIVYITYDFFSISFLLKTLLLPWKRDEVAPAEPSLQMMVQAFWFNLITRLLGAIVRTAVIVAGLISLVVVIFSGVIGIVLIFTFPLSILAALVLAIMLMVSGQTALLIIGLSIIVVTAASLVILYRFWLVDRFVDGPVKQTLKDVDLANTNLHPWLNKRVVFTLGGLKTPRDLKALLCRTPEINFILNRIGIDPADLTLSPLADVLTWHTIIAQAAQQAVKEDQPLIRLGDILVAIFQLDPTLKNVLIGHDLTPEDIANVVAWQTRLWELANAESPLLNPKELRLTGGIGKNWASGYTNFLDRFARELTDTVSSESYDHQFVAHSDQIDQIERILARSGKHNVLIVGETGVGKRTMILGFARRVLIGKTLAPLRYKRILELDVSAILAHASNPGELESNFVNLLNEAVRAGNVILYIDDIERLLSGDPETVGSINVGELLIPYLESDQFQLIGAMPPAQFETIVSRQPSLSSAFEKIDIVEPSEEATLRILQEVVLGMESHYGVYITYQALRQIVRQASRYMANKKFPEKGVDLIDEIAVETSSRSTDKVITNQIVDSILSQKLDIPIGQTQDEEKAKLLNLEELLHKRVINQVNAIAAISNAMRRSRAGVGSEKKPIGTFLFLGPTGVGKTETAKALASVYFGTDSSMIRFDMSEFQELSSIGRLIGDNVQATGGRLTDAIREKPFSLILLDEIEKAHPKILDLFLQVLDEGRLTDALGQVADFRNAIIIATSNAGAEWLRQRIKNDQPSSKEQTSGSMGQVASSMGNDQTHDTNYMLHDTKIDMGIISKELIDYVQTQNIFKPEFLNRFDEITAFRPLNISELEQVVDLQVTALNKRLADRQISVSVTPGARTKLAQVGFDPTFGARALNRTIVALVENKIAQALLKEELKKGGTFEVNEEMVQ